MENAGAGRTLEHRGPCSVRGEGFATSSAQGRVASPDEAPLDVQVSGAGAARAFRRPGSVGTAARVRGGYAAGPW